MRHKTIMLVIHLQHAARWPLWWQWIHSRTGAGALDERAVASGPLTSDVAFANGSAQVVDIGPWRQTFLHRAHRPDQAPPSKSVAQKIPASSPEEESSTHVE